MFCFIENILFLYNIMTHRSKIDIQLVVTHIIQLIIMDHFKSLKLSCL